MKLTKLHVGTAFLILGTGAALAWQAGGPSDEAQDAASMTGVRSDAAGSTAEDTPEEGIQSVPPVAASENVIQVVSTAEGSVQSIRGIKGIDTVMLQNLEAVLRMQEPPPPPEAGGGGGRAAAALLTMEEPVEAPLEIEADARVEHAELEIEGS